MICNRCNTENPIDAKFCFKCGLKFEKTRLCPSCGKQILSKDKYCEFCGTKVYSFLSRKYNKTILTFTIIELIFMITMFICSIFAVIDDTVYTFNGVVRQHNMHYIDVSLGELMTIFMIVAGGILILNLPIYIYPKIVKRILYPLTFASQMVLAVLSTLTFIVDQVTLDPFGVIVIGISALLVITATSKIIYSIKKDIKKEV